MLWLADRCQRGCQRGYLFNKIMKRMQTLPPAVYLENYLPVKQVRKILKRCCGSVWMAASCRWEGTSKQSNRWLDAELHLSMQPEGPEVMWYKEAKRHKSATPTSVHTG